MAKQIKQQIEDFLSYKDTTTKMQLNLGQIDGMVNGIEKGNLISIVGQSIDGRDFMLNTLIKNLAIDQKVPSLILNLATTEASFYEQFVSNVSDISTDDLREDDIVESGKQLEDTELYVDFPTDRSLDFILSTIKEYAEKGVKLVFIDLVQAVDYVDDFDSFCEDELIYHKEKVSRRLSQLAKDLKINIFVGAAVSYMTYEREEVYEGDRPQLKDLKMAHRLDEYCDLALGLFIPYAHHIYYSGEKNLCDMIEVTILKNRINFKMGRFYMYFDIYHNRITDDKTYNKQAVLEQMKNNSAYNELVVGMMLDSEDCTEEAF